MRPEAIIQQLFSGVSNGMILFIVASGLTLVFGVMRVINFAHGSLYMLGAFLATAVAGYFSATTLGFFAALLIVPVIVAIVGLTIEILLFKRIYDKEHLLQLLLTYGLTLILGDVVRAIWGGDIYRLRPPEFLRGRIEFLDMRFPRYDLFLITIGIVIVLGLWFLLQRTRYGRITRAAVTNPEMLSALGINVDRIFTGVFMLGAWLAGLGGALFAGRAAVGLGMDADIIVQAFAVVVIGGLGSFFGALLGALLIGITLSLGLLFPELPVPPQALPFLAMALILILRPWGLLGRSEVKRL
ncbi:MAG: hypothetical protein OHK0046_18750 [Anaerolineae bacterium]